MSDRLPPQGFTDIPFILAPTRAAPFSELGNRAGVDDPAKMLEGWTQLEAAIAGFNTVSAALLDILARRRRAVARIIVPPGGHIDYRGRVQPAGWLGSAFLVGKNLLLTNHHVLNTPTVAGAAFAEFDYEVRPDDLLGTRLDGETPALRLQLSPSRLFLTSKVSGGLDYTFVWIDEIASERFDFIPMERASFTAGEFDPTFVIHHPQGRRKEASLDDTELVNQEGTVLHYAADTEGGSSGSPVFDRYGRLIALHHASNGGLSYTLSDGRSVSVINEGIKISSIALDLESIVQRGAADAQLAHTVLGFIKGSDTLAGFFGGLGRDVSAASAVERVRAAYTATEQDVDFGFWNVGWLADKREDDKKLEAVVTVIADLNLDIWGLLDISESGVRDVVEELEAKYGEHYGWAFVEPDPGEGRPASAMIWRKQTVAGERVAWPEEIAQLWSGEAADAADAFSQSPALFKFDMIRNTVPYRFYVVPLQLKAAAKGTPAGQLAAKLITGVVQILIEEHGYDRDWILGGDFDAALTSGSFTMLEAAHFIPMAAQDKTAGAIAYLKSPRSPVDNVFVPENVVPVAGSHGLMTVANGRSLDKYLRPVVDRRPTAMRVSVSESDSVASAQDVGETAARLLDDVRHGRLPQDRRTSIPSMSRQERRLAAGDAPTAEAEAGDYVWRGLRKEAFLSRNRARLLAEIAAVNAKLATIYGQGFTPLTEQDVWVLIYIEAGLTAGKVDPDFRHSEGEHGLLPLPENIRTFWNGPSAPAWDEPMSLQTNLHHFFLYLGHVMNKPVKQTPRFMLYRDLFKWDGISASPERKTQLLAGVVHGYFISQNYSDRKVPFDDILNGFAAGRRADDIMRQTQYVHAGKPLMTNRANNIEAALRLLEQEGQPSPEAVTTEAEVVINRPKINRDVAAAVRSALGNAGENLFSTPIKAVFIGNPAHWRRVSRAIRAKLLGEYPKLRFDDRFAEQFFSKTFGDYIEAVADLVEKSLRKG